MRNVLKRDFIVHKFVFRYLVCKIWSILYSTFCEPISETLTSDADNQLARGIQFKSIRLMRAEPSVGGVGGEAPHEPGGLGGRALPNVIFFLNSSKSQTNSLRMVLKNRPYLKN